MDVQALINNFNCFAEERDWDQFHTVKNLSMALSVEVSELVEIMQWATEDEIQSWIKDDQNKKLQIEEELADIFMYLLKICDKTHVDLEKAVKSKMIKNAEKYPVEKSKGSHKKYTEL